MTTDFAGDDISADIRAAMGETPEPAVVETLGAAAAEEVVPKPVAEDAGAQETAEQKRVRDEAGRFAKAQESVQATPASPVAPEPPLETIRPPTSWSATAKSEFSKLPPIIQQEVLKREADIESGKAQWDQKGERLNKFDAIIAPHRDRLQLAQQDEFGYVQALIRADEMLRTNPSQAIVQIASLYGINLTGQPMQPQPQAQAGPTPEQVQASIQQAVQAQLARERDEQAKAQVTSEWETFRTSVEHPYAENVKMHMAALLREGAADSLQAAYEQACWANPEVRVLMQATLKPRPPVVSTPAGLSVTGAKGNMGHIPQVNGVNGSIEDDIRAAMQEVSGRA